MNLLTKISIVLLLVVAVFGSIVFIQQATVPANYMGLWKHEQAKSAMLEQSVRHTSLALARAEKEIGELRAAFAQDSAAKQTDILSKVGTIRDRELAIADLNRKLEAASIDSRAKQLTLDGAEAARKILSEQLDGLRGTLKDVEDRYRQTAENLKQVEAYLERELRVNQALRLQIAELDEKVKELTNKIQLAQPGKGAEGGEEAKPAGVVNGQVTAVNNNMASINIGSAHGVAVGQKLIIYREDKFIGYLKVEEVFPSEAAGIVVDQQFEPLRGDKVTSSLK
ncbi:MAG: hypothetical protein HZA50_09715 [Planctomycetes bacterium]|nr:hypothetical protein [Planctomycetota bacterium]